jgi:hypothetical protein
MDPSRPGGPASVSPTGIGVPPSPQWAPWPQWSHLRPNITRKPRPSPPAPTVTGSHHHRHPPAAALAPTGTGALVGASARAGGQRRPRVRWRQGTGTCARPLMWPENRAYFGGFRTLRPLIAGEQPKLCRSAAGNPSSRSLRSNGRHSDGGATAARFRAVPVVFPRDYAL